MDGRSGRPQRLGVLAIVAAAATGLAALAVAWPGSSPGTDHTRADAHLIRSLERQRLTAVVQADMPTLRRLHASDFQLVTPYGDVQDRDEYLESLASGQLDYLRFEPTSPVRVRRYDRAAVVRYRSEIDIVVVGLGRLSHQVWHTDVYELDGRRWRVVESHATAIGPLPEPS